MIRALGVPVTWVAAGLLLATFSAGRQDPGEKPSDGNSPAPAVYTVYVTARSQAMQKDAFNAFMERLKKPMPHLSMRKRGSISTPKEGLDEWRFVGDARVIFDPPKLRSLFLDFKVQKMAIEVAGEAVTRVRRSTWSVIIRAGNSG